MPGHGNNKLAHNFARLIHCACCGTQLRHETRPCTRKAHYVHNQLCNLIANVGSEALFVSTMSRYVTQPLGLALGVARRTTWKSRCSCKRSAGLLVPTPTLPAAQATRGLLGTCVQRERRRARHLE